MSETTMTRSCFGIFSQIQESYKSILRSFERYRVMRKTYNELSKLSDAELSDIGISRSSIRSIAMEQYYDDRG